MDLYATCDKDGERRVAEYKSKPRLNEFGNFSNWQNTRAWKSDLQDLPDFPAPGTFKKVKRMSILPLEIEYEEPPFVGKVWACCNGGSMYREIRQDAPGSHVECRSGGGGWIGGGAVGVSHEFLSTIPDWPAPGERRELRCVPTLNIEWADEPAE